MNFYCRSYGKKQGRYMYRSSMQAVYVEKLGVVVMCDVPIHELSLHVHFFPMTLILLVNAALLFINTVSNPIIK